jgi:biotin carboxyl carrier protein
VTTEIEIHGERQPVDVRRVGDRWMVTLNGRALAVDVADVGGRWSMLVGPPEGGPHSHDVGAGFSRPATSYEVAIEAGPAGERVVFVNGRAFPVRVADPRAMFGRRADSAHRTGDITAPMPGRVVKVLVARGDAVAARQPLVIVEAMKMENELRAPRAGTVADVRVSEGSSVEAHAVLIVIE